MGSRSLVYALLMVAIATVDCNLEADALNTWKNNLTDPNNILQTWNSTLVNPCTWFHVTCNNESSVTRLDLGNASLSGSLVPELANLTNLKYLELYKNNITGSIPSEFGKLSALVRLDLFHNRLSGPIPSSLGNLTALRSLRLNSNLLSGTIPMEVIQLVQLGNLVIMNVSDNEFEGTVRPTNSTGFAITEIIQDPKA